MMKRYITQAKEELEQIVDFLLLNGNLSPNKGLINGEMGVAIFFFHYWKFTQNELFYDYAFALLEDIQDQIHLESPTDYENGLLGIGVGLNYLVKNRLIKVENNCFEDLDNLMNKLLYSKYRHTYTLYNGLIGDGYYWLFRYYNSNESYQIIANLNYILKKIDEETINITLNELFDVRIFLSKLYAILEFRNKVVDILYNQRFRRIDDIVNNSFLYGENDILMKEMVRQMKEDVFLKHKTFIDWNSYYSRYANNSKCVKLSSNLGLLGYTGEAFLRLSLLENSITDWVKIM